MLRPADSHTLPDTAVYLAGTLVLRLDKSARDVVAAALLGAAPVPGGALRLLFLAALLLLGQPLFSRVRARPLPALLVLQWARGRLQ